MGAPMSSIDERKALLPTAAGAGRAGCWAVEVRWIAVCMSIALDPVCIRRLTGYRWRRAAEIQIMNIRVLPEGTGEIGRVIRSLLTSCRKPLKNIIFFRGGRGPSGFVTWSR